MEVRSLSIESSVHNDLFEDFDFYLSGSLVSSEMKEI